MITWTRVEWQRMNQDDRIVVNPDRGGHDLIERPENRAMDMQGSQGTPFPNRNAKLQEEIRRHPRVPITVGCFSIPLLQKSSVSADCLLRVLYKLLGF
jgi:hypothetical protein